MLSVDDLTHTRIEMLVSHHFCQMGLLPITIRLIVCIDGNYSDTYFLIIKTYPAKKGSLSNRVAFTYSLSGVDAAE